MNTAQITDPYELMDAEGVNLSSLGERGKKTMAMYERFAEKTKVAEQDEAVRKVAEKGLAKALEKLREIIQEHKDKKFLDDHVVIAKPAPQVAKPEFSGPFVMPEEKTEPKARKQPKAKKAPSRKEKSTAALKKVETQFLPDLDACRAAIAEERKRQREANPPEKKPRKTRITKLKERLMAIARLIPEELRDDPEVIQATETILLDALHQLCALWKINRIEVAEKALTEQFDQLESKAESK